MGAGDWAGRMIEKLQREFDVDAARALQITTRVRQLLANPEINALQDAGLLTQSFGMELVNDLIALLHDHDAATIEGRWNAIAKDQGIYAIVGADALLYDPSKAGLDPDTELVAENGDTRTIQDAMHTAWRACRIVSTAVPVD